jgi:hypothetical protein
LSDLAELKNKHLGETIWVLGSGATLDFVKPEFFADKLVVATNFSARATGIKSQYAFTHYHFAAAELASICDYVVTLRRDTISRQDWSGEIADNIVLINQDSYIGPGSSWNPFTTHAPRADSLVYGSSSFHGAMHLAAWLGASSIVLVGADCGTLDGETNVPNYFKDNGAYPLALYNRDHKQMKDWLVQEYGVGVYSLNPFINLNLEGHKFQGV